MKRIPFLSLMRASSAGHGRRAARAGVARVAAVRPALGPFIGMALDTLGVWQMAVRYFDSPLIGGIVAAVAAVLLAPTLSGPFLWTGSDPQ